MEGESDFINLNLKLMPRPENIEFQLSEYFYLEQLYTSFFSNHPYDSLDNIDSSVGIL